VIRRIDWELAALGAPLYDLAFFTDGVEPQARDRMWDAYRDSASQHNAPLPGKTQMHFLVDCYRLHRIFDWLSRSIEKQFSEDKVIALVAQAEKQSAQFLM
jgi:thiamine kinase-like enzyme